MISDKELEFLEKMHDDFLFKDIKYDGNDESHCTIMKLYGTIFELSGSCIILLRNQHTIGIPILLRSIVEAFIDLLNLVKNRDYYYNIQASCFSELYKFFNNMDEKEIEEWRKVFPEIDNFEVLKETLACYNEEGYRKLDIYEKFKQAKMQNEYTMYRALCWEAHNNLFALDLKHTEVDRDNSLIFIYKNIDCKLISQNTQNVSLYLLRAIELVHFFMCSVPIEVLKIYREEFNTLYSLTEENILR